MKIDQKNIPAEVVEAATRKIAKMRGCDKAVFSKCVSAIEAGVPCKCEDEARAAIAAALAAWPGAWHKNGAGTFQGAIPYPAFILPMPQEASDDQ